jgi:ABC-type transport system involved in cytochrome c biogenesis ATPase subunit
MAGRVKRAPPVPWLVGSGLACMRNEQVIVRDVNFTLHKGNAMVLTGPNASGKSTFLRVVSKSIFSHLNSSMVV